MSLTLFQPTRIEASPGPWGASDVHFRNGAILIEDAEGEIVGWATDAAGATIESANPDRRPRAQILLNASLIALAPELLDVVRLAAKPAGVSAPLTAEAPTAVILARFLDLQNQLLLVRQAALPLLQRLVEL